MSVRKKFDVSEFFINTKIRSKSVNAEQRTAEVVWSRGTKGKRRGFFGDYYEELSMDKSAVDMSRLNAGAPVLASHDATSLDSVIGVVERAWIDGDEGKALVRFSSDEAAQSIFNKVREGILKNISVGYDVSEYTDVSLPDDEVPTYRATKWEPMEISVVAIGFDKHAQIRNQNKESIKSIEIKTKPHDKENPMDKDQLLALERTRCVEIRKAVKDAKLSPDLAEEYINQGTSVEQARLNIEMFAKYAKQQETPIQSAVSVSVGTDERDKKREAVEQALLHRVDSRSFNTRNDLSNLSLIEICKVLDPSLRYENAYTTAKRAMTSSDLPIILASIAEKSAQARMLIAPRSYKAWASQGTLRNFKEALDVKAGELGSLQKRDENGEYTYAALSESGERVQLANYGRITSFSQEMLVNDDLSVISKVASETGSVGTRLENSLVYSVLLNNAAMSDGFNLFSSEHKNEGTVGAISDTTFADAFKKMRNQLSLDGQEFLNVSPAFLIVGPDLEALARKYLMSIQSTKASDSHPFAQSVELVVEPLITDDKYFFAASPQMIDTVKLYRLEGRESVQVQSRINWRTDAMELKVSHAVAAGAPDFRGLFRNKAS